METLTENRMERYRCTRYDECGWRGFKYECGTGYEPYPQKFSYGREYVTEHYKSCPKCGWYTEEYS